MKCRDIDTIDAVALGGCDHRPQPGVILGRGVFASKQPILPVMLSFA